MSGPKEGRPRKPGGRARPGENSAEGIDAAVDPSAPLRNVDAEEAVLSKLMQADNFGSDALSAASTLRLDDFTSGARERIFAAAVVLSRRGGRVDRVTLADALASVGDLDFVGGELELRRLSELQISGAGAEPYVEIVQKHGIRRRCIAACERWARMFADPQTDPETIRLEPLQTAMPRASALQFRGVDEVRAEAASAGATAWLVDRLVPAGSTSVWGGRPKSGKSTLALQLIAALERGERFLDRETTKTKTVLATEEGASTLLEKFDIYGITEARIVTRRDLGGFAAIEPMRELIEAATVEAEKTGAKLILVDTFAAWSGLGGDRENDAGEVLRAVKPFGAAAERGIAVAVLHHSRKAESQDPADAIRGSGALAGGFDIVFELKRADRTSSATARTLSALSRYAKVDVTGELSLDFVAGRYHVCASSADAVEAGVARAILDAVRAAGRPLERDQVLARVGGNAGNKSRQLKKLVAAGELKEAGAGVKGDPFVYSIPSSTDAFGSVPTCGNGIAQFDHAGCHPSDSVLPKGRERNPERDGAIPFRPSDGNGTESAERAVQALFGGEQVDSAAAGGAP